MPSNEQVYKLEIWAEGYLTDAEGNVISGNTKQSDSAEDEADDNAEEAP